MSTSARHIDLEEISKKLLILLSNRNSADCGNEVKKDALQNIFENIFPYFQDPNSYVYYLPLPKPKLAIDFSPSWKTAFNKSVLNHYIRDKNSNNNSIKINLDVDNIIGEAIQNRISKTTGNSEPKPYEFQIRAIAEALAALDFVRSYLRPGDISGFKKRLSERKLSPTVIAALAPTGGGKTEIFEAIALQLTLDSYVGALYKGDKSIADFTKAIIVYPMKAFMIDHFRRFIEDITYINAKIDGHLSKFSNVNSDSKKISIGILHGDSPEKLKNEEEILEDIEYLLGNNNCPVCGSQLYVKISGKSKDISSFPHYTIKCKSGHLINIIISKDKLFGEGNKIGHIPDILLTTVDSFNYILLKQKRHILLGKEKTTLPPLLLAVDEPHVYTGVFGSNVSLIFREFDYVTQQYVGSQNYKPLKIATSATMPYAQEFLCKLFVESENNVKVILPTYTSSPTENNKGFLAFLPNLYTYGFQKAIIEIVTLIAGLLPKELRKILVFVDSVNLAERLKRYMEEYISRGFPDYKKCLHLLQNDVYDPIKGINPNAIRIAVHTRYLDQDQREEIEKGLRSTPPKYNIVIATPTLELGIDIGDITVVVIAGLPPTPEKFAQRAGRAGRRGKGLVVIIGNSSSAVDRYYLDGSRIESYLKTSFGYDGSLNYMLPLNPLNLESIRRFLGNFMAIYGNIQGLDKIGSLSRKTDEILKDYIKLSIKRVSEELSSFNRPSKVLENIVKFAKSIENSIGGELKSRFQEITGKFWDKEITKFVDPNYAKEFFLNGTIDFIPLLDDIRSINKPIRIRFYNAISALGKPIREIEDRSIEKALVYYSIREIDPKSNKYFLPAIKKLHGKAIAPLRGTLQYYSPRGVSELFEVSGLEYTVHKKEYQQLVDSITNYIENLKLLKNIPFLIDKKIKEVKEEINITTARIYNLIDSFDNFLKASKPDDTHIVEPRIFHLTKAGILGINNSKLILPLNTQQFAVPLDYFEVYKINSKGKSYWEFLKLESIECQNCKNDEKIEIKEFDSQKHLLNLFCKNCNNSFKFQGNNRDAEIHQIETRPVVFTAIIKDNNKDYQSAKSIIVSNPFRNLHVLIGNVGFRVSSVNDQGVRRFMRIREKGSKKKQCIIGTDFETQGIEIVIDWSKQAYTLEEIKTELEEEYTELGIDISPSLSLTNDFKIRVTHTLSHMIMNFAPIYTGGNRWDINEYLEFKMNNDGDITESKVIVFDRDEGGNGVSEVTRYFLIEILATALTEATKYYIKTNDPIIKFLGEPGVTFFGVWPKCQYGNSAISRSLTLLYFKRLLGLQSIYELQNITPDQLAKVIEFEE